MKKHNNINSICFRAAFLPAVILVTLALTISGFLFKYHIDNVIERELARHELISQLFVKSANADIIIGNEHSLYIIMKEYTDNYQLQKLIITNQNQNAGPTVINFIKSRQVCSSWLVSGISPERYISIQSKIDANAIIIPLLSSLLIILLCIIASIVMFARIKRMLNAKIIQPLNQTLTCDGNDISWFDQETAATEVAALYHRTNEFIRTLHQQRDVIEANKIKQAKYDIALQMAHDIRSPVLALETIAGMFDEVASEAKLMLHSVTNQISQIANDVLEKHSSKTNCKLPTIELIRQIFDEKKYTCNNDNIKFHFKVGNVQSSAKVTIPDIQLTRILSNIINNSIESTISTNKVEVEVYFKDKMVNIVLKDTGCGISQEILEKLFTQPYNSTKHNGNRLALIYAHKVILSHQGKLEIQSTLGHGTTVQLNLPILY